MAGGLVLCACSPVDNQAQPAPTYVESPSAPPQQPAYYPDDSAPPAAAAPDPLDQLMGPVALYPDPIISILLPASTFPGDISAAASYLGNGGDPGQADNQPWDPSVRSLAHYPDVVGWMAQNQAWTQAVGAAYVAEPAQVMEAIQRLRELARDAGTLTSNQQQQVIVDAGYVEIEPAQPNVIYIPRYDTQVVYVDQPYYDYNGPFFAYSAPYQAGVWLTYGCNWGGRSVVVVDQGYWRDDRGWRHDPYSVSISVSFNSRPRPWGFPEGRPRPQAPSGWRENARVINAHPIPGAPQRPPQSAERDIHTRGAAAVAVVVANPSAFKGRPVNRAILTRSPAPPSASRPAPRAGTAEAGAANQRPERAAPDVQKRPEQAPIPPKAAPYQPQKAAPEQPSRVEHSEPVRSEPRPQAPAPQVPRPEARPAPTEEHRPAPQVEAPRAPSASERNEEQRPPAEGHAAEPKATPHPEQHKEQKAPPQKSEPDKKDENPH
jgi:hypothetical protein